MVHKAAVEYLSTTIPGAINNHYACMPHRISIDGRVPDVVVKDSSGRIREVYEVETIAKGALPKRSRVKRILVIALNDGDWDEVKVLTDKGSRALSEMAVRHSVIDGLDAKIKVQRRRLKGYNKRISRKLTFAREKKHVDEGWE